MATVKGQVSWPDWACSAQGCPRVEDTPVHFADAAANRTFTAVAGSSGGYSIRIPAGSYVVIAGRADRSPYKRQITVQPGEHLTLITHANADAQRRCSRAVEALRAVGG